jgi:hypothetical protein
MPAERANAYQVLLMLERITQQELEDCGAAAAAAAAATSAATGSHDSWGKVMQAAAAAAAPMQPATSSSAPAPPVTRPADARHRRVSLPHLQQQPPLHRRIMTSMMPSLLPQRLHAEAAPRLGLGQRPAAALVRARQLPPHVVRRCSSSGLPPQPCCLRLTSLADQAHSVLQSAFADAEASNHCITLGAGSSVTRTSMPGGGHMLHVKDALGRQVKMTVQEGGSAAQLDMWALMMDKVQPMLRTHRHTLTLIPKALGKST